MTSAPAQRWIWRTHLFQFNGTSLRRRATPGPGDLPGGGSAGRGRWWWRSTAAAPRCPGRRTAAPGAAHRPPRHWPPRPPLSWVNRCSVRDDAQPRERGAALIGRDAARDVAILVGGGQLRQREGGRPHGAFVEVRRVLEAERRVPRVELLRAFEEADDLAVL